jgi:hypothetical protein
MQDGSHAARDRRPWRPTGPGPIGDRGDDLHGVGLQRARPRPSAVDADAAPSRFRADRRTSEPVGRPSRGTPAAPGHAVCWCRGRRVALARQWCGRDQCRLGRLVDGLRSRSGGLRAAGHRHDEVGSKYLVRSLEVGVQPDASRSTRAPTPSRPRSARAGSPRRAAPLYSCSPTSTAATGLASSGNPKTRTAAELLTDCEEDRTLPAVLVGMLREADR